LYGSARSHPLTTAPLLAKITRATPARRAVEIADVRAVARDAVDGAPAQRAQLEARGIEMRAERAADQAAEASDEHHLSLRVRHGAPFRNSPGR